MSKKPSVLVIFLTVLVDLIGFGIVLPLLPVFAKLIDGMMAGGRATKLLRPPAYEHEPSAAALSR